MQKKKGISLIVLVITIIVMIILAGAVVLTLSGENGLFNIAQTARTETDRKVFQEQIDIARLEAMASTAPKEYTDKNGDTVIIPAKFSATGIDGENTIDEGFVIIDYLGNEFVWVPVDKNNFESNFIRIAGYANGSLQSLSSYGEADATGSNPNVKGGEESDETKQEAIAMYESVKKYGGFYIGRYEAGKETITLDDGTTKNKAVVKKGADLYNYIQWGKTLIDGTDGAAEAARNLAIENKYGNNVHSTLCYSVQWDAAIKFIDPSYTGYAKDSTKQGWFSDNYNDTSTGNIDTNPTHITGKDLIYSNATTKIANKHKNIYDLGGNAREWVMESVGAYRCVRGGYYKGTGLYRSASNRTNGTFYDKYEYIGFRIALYLD